ncbi:rhodanese-like domain-containing protein [Proteinivorax hydrogeniformans]|uniref:Rhodanese-like domain-containing protein n=1 Tax=Proteinivorax hydrogeniformans TaxID=1826727 RepID=A0AAU8HTX1_9FIRM
MDSSKTKEKNRIFIKTVLLLLLPALVLLVVGILLLPKDLGGHYLKISGQEAEILLDVEDTNIIDMRPKEQFEQNRIPQSINVSFDELKERYHTLDTRKVTVLVPQSDSEGEEMAKFLVEQGFSEVYIIKGGIDSWTGELGDE